MELIFIFAIVLIKISLVNCLQVVQIVRTFRVYTFVYNEVFAVLFMNQSMGAMGTVKARIFGKTAVLCWRKKSLADFTSDLIFLPSIVPGQIVHRSAACRACAVHRNITFNTAEDRPDSFVVTLLIVGNEIQPVPVLLKGDDLRKLVNPELLIFRRMGIIKSPLFQRDLFADK